MAGACLRVRLVWRSTLFRRDVHANDFTALTFRADFKRATTDLAIRGEALLGQGGIHRHIERLAAERALHCGKFFHVGNVIVFGQSATTQANKFSAAGIKSI